MLHPVTHFTWVCIADTQWVAVTRWSCLSLCKHPCFGSMPAQVHYTVEVNILLGLSNVIFPERQRQVTCFLTYWAGCHFVHAGCGSQAHRIIIPEKGKKKSDGLLVTHTSTPHSPPPHPLLPQQLMAQLLSFHERDARPADNACFPLEGPGFLSI